MASVPVKCTKSILLVLALSASFLASAASDQIRMEEALLSVEWRSEFSGNEKIKLEQWLTKAAHTARQLYGQLPLPKSRIVIHRSRRTSNSPVPWAKPIRAGSQGIEFYVDVDQPLKSFLSDWTAPHEFSHLFIPYPGQQDLWLSEGFASYYQNVLMAREGILTPEAAWRKLYEGFARAERDRNGRWNLRELSADRRGRGGTMRVYWSGALLFLEVDLALRRSSEGRQSLDNVVEAFNSCCRDEKHSWRGVELMAKFDQLSGTGLFSNLYRRYAESTAIPDHRPLFKELGLRIDRGQVVFIPTASGSAQMRSRLMQARHKPFPLAP